MIDRDALRQCQARNGQKTWMRCQGQVTETTTHLGDHWVFDPDGSGNKIFWSELVAMWPAVPPEGVGSARDAQVGGDHYRKYRIQPWDVIDEYDLSFYAGNALKYLLRAGDKGDALEDLRKCRHYLDKLIEMEEGGD